MKHLKTLDELALEKARALQSGLSRLRMEDPPKEDEDEEDEDEEEDEEDEEEDEDEDEELGEAGKKALQRERAERKRLQKELKAALKKTEDDSEREKREATEAVEERYQGVIARAEFRSALAEAGLKKGQKKLMKLLDLTDVEVEVDDSGEYEVSGIAEQVKELKKDFPELFGKGREGAGKGDGGSTGDPVGSEKKTTAERLAAAARGEN